MSIREKLLMQKIKKREKMKKVLAEKKGKQQVKPSKKVESGKQLFKNLIFLGNLE